MKLEDFLNGDVELETSSKDVFPTISWRKQVEKVIEAYIGECEKYRREHKALQEQVNEMARVISSLQNRLRLR